MIDTKRVTNRRELRFATVEEAIRDAQGLADRDAAGNLVRLGNWTLGQALGHVAAWATFPFEGYPSRPPLFVRIVMKFMKGRRFGGPMPAGIRIPGVAAGTFATEDMPASEGLARLTRALERLQREAPTAPNPLFGPLTHAEWLALNLNHAALHQSFFAPAR